MNAVLKTLALAFPLSLALGGAAHAQLVNIKAYGDDGAAAQIYGYPVVPGTLATFNNAPTLTLAAGDYTIADAAGQAGALYDAWNFQTSVGGSWTSHFVVGEYVSGTGASALYSTLLDATIPNGPGHFGGYDTEAQAAAVFAATAPYALHLDHTTTIGFAAADYYLPDNAGGISLRVSSVGAVPEPTSLALMFGGLVGVTAAARRRRR